MPASSGLGRVASGQQVVLDVWVRGHSGHMGAEISIEHQGRMLNQVWWIACLQSQCESERRAGQKFKVSLGFKRPPEVGWGERMTMDPEKESTAAWE